MTTSRLDLKIHGMDCADEVGLLKRALVPLTGEASLAFDVLRGRPLVHLDGTKRGEKEILAAIATTGLRAEPFTRVAAGPSRAARVRTVLTAAFAVLLVVAVALHAGLDGLAAAVGSEGLGASHTLPWVVRGVHLACIVAGASLWMAIAADMGASLIVVANALRLLGGGRRPS